MYLITLMYILLSTCQNTTQSCQWYFNSLSLLLFQLLPSEKFVNTLYQNISSITLLVLFFVFNALVLCIFNIVLFTYLNEHMHCIIIVCFVLLMKCTHMYCFIYFMYFHVQLLYKQEVVSGHVFQHTFFQLSYFFMFECLNGQKEWTPTFKTTSWHNLNA